MPHSTIGGVVALFEPRDADSFARLAAELSARELRLLVAAGNYEALTSPAPETELVVHRGAADEAPRLTSSMHPPHSPDLGARPVTARVAVRSLVERPREVERGEHHLLIGPDAATGDVAARTSLYWRLRQALERRYPLQYDRLRQLLLARRQRGLDGHAIPRRGLSESERAVKALGPAAERRPAVLIGLHWLDLGGAERWAVETVRLAKEAGFLPIVVTDRESTQPWITRPEFDDTVVIPLSFPLREPKPEAFLRALLETFDVRGVVVHHCAWLYDRLPLIRQLRRGVGTADSLHIIEYAGGGYPATGVHLDDFLDVHHVISPQLEQWLTGPQGVAPEKIAMAPLIGLTAEEQGHAFAARVGGPIRIGFVGRFVRQKRPYLFLNLVKALRDRGVDLTAIMHGSGELDGVVNRRLRADGLSDLVELRGHDVPVEETLRDIDLLVISSQNEGITLTSLEAIAAGVPVLSADVGSQATVIPPTMLVPREPHLFVERSVETIERLIGDEPARERAWQQEMELAQAFSAHESATDWMRSTLRAWSE